MRDSHGFVMDQEAMDNYAFSLYERCLQVGAPSAYMTPTNAMKIEDCLRDSQGYMVSRYRQVSRYSVEIVVTSI